MGQESHQLQDVQTAVLAVAITNQKPDTEKYNKYKQNLVDQLSKSGEELVRDPIPFYKDGVKNPAGYVIETNNEVLVCYHGTQFGKVFGSGGKEILHDLQASGAKMNFGGEEVSVHSGFKKEFMSSKDSMHQALSQTNVKEKGVHLSGHSLGAAVSQIAAMDLATHFGVKVNKVTTFGGPRVFQKKAADLYNSKGLGDVTLRVKQDKDPVTRVVPRGLYHHTGNKVKLPSPKGGLHSGAVYRKIAENMKDEDIQNARASDKPWSFKESYLKPVMEMTKEVFAKIQKHTIGAIVNKIRKNLSSHSRPNAGASGPSLVSSKARSANQDSGRGR